MRWLVAIAPLLALWSSAQVRTDGTMGPRQTLTGPGIQVPASLGRQAGPNLFHSFQSFNIAGGQSVRFSGPGSVRNVLARVTGGAPSLIEGTLGCDIPSANLYLMNPSGVIFGPGSALDVKGSFAVTSADSIRLGKSGRFNATPLKDEVLSVAHPAAFGFLGKGSGVAVIGTNLSVAEGKVLSVVSKGRVTLFSGGLLAPSGRINVIAGGSAGEVAHDPADAASAPQSTLSNYANLNARATSVLNASGTRGGAITLLARSAVLEQTSIVSGTSGAQDGRPIHLQLSRTLLLTGGSSINVINSGTGRGGDLSVTARKLEIDGGGNAETSLRSVGLLGAGGSMDVRAGVILLRRAGSISVLSAAQGAAGQMNLSAREIILQSGATVSGSVLAATEGARLTFQTDRLTLDGESIITLLSLTALVGGALNIDAGEMIVTGGSRIIGIATSGPAGTIRIAADDLTVNRRSQIISGTSGPFPGGDVFIDVGNLRIDGIGSTILAGPDENATARGGNLFIRAANVSITHRGSIGVGTVGTGDGGNLVLEAQNLSIRGTGVPGSGGILAGVTEGASGAGGNVSIAARRIDLSRGGIITVDTEDTGPGGLLTVTADELNLTGSGTVLRANTSALLNGGAGGNVQLEVNTLKILDNAAVVAGTIGSGAGGSALIRARSITIDGANSTIFIGTLAAQNGGDAGTLELVTSSLNLTNGGLIFGGTRGSGDGGNVAISADSILIHRGLAGIHLGTSAPVNGGNAGRLNLRTGTLKILGSGTILAATLGSGRGGELNIDAERLYMRGVSGDVPEESSTAIIAGTQGSGDSGRLRLRAGEMRLLRGASIAVGTSGSGDGGDATIIAGKVTLDRSGILAASDGGEADDGVAGSISLTATRVVSLRNGSSIAADAEVADGGSVTVAAPRLFLRDSRMTTRAGGAGGSVRLTAKQMVYLFRSEINATGASAIGDIVIDPQFTVLDHSRLVTSTQGQGGNVNIRTDRYFTSPDSAITLAPGAVLSLTVFNPDSDIAGQLVPVEARLGSRETTFAQECARRLEVRISSYLILGRGGMPVEAGGLVPSLP